MSLPLQRVRTWRPSSNDTFELGQSRWVRVEGDVPAGLVLRTRDMEDELPIVPGRTIDFGGLSSNELRAPATSNGAHVLEVWTGSTPIGETDTAPRGGSPRPWLEHFVHASRSIAPSATFPMLQRTWIPYSTSAGQGFAHPYKRIQVVAQGNFSFTIDALDVFAGTSSVLIAQHAAVPRPSGFFAVHFVLDFPPPRLELLATNTSANNLQLLLHAYGTR